MNNKRKNVIIAFLFLATVILLILLILSVNSNKGSKNTNIDEKTEQIEVLNSQLQEYQKNDDTSITEKKNVCTNFLRTYYSVQHSTTKSAALPECKKYLTEQLYNKLSPGEKSGTEYAQKNVDIDYTSSISIKDAYIDCGDSDKLIIRCAIKRTVNGMQSINEYFVFFRVENINDEWLISNFELISIQGG